MERLQKMSEKKTLKEQISELYDRDCYGYMRVVRPEEIFKIIDGLVAELQKQVNELSHKPVPKPHRADTCETGWLDGVRLGIKELEKVLALLGVQTK